MYLLCICIILYYFIHSCGGNLGRVLCIIRIIIYYVLIMYFVFVYPEAVCPPAAPGGRLWLLFMGTPDRPLSLDPAGHRFSRFCDSPDFAAAELPQCMVCFDFDVDEVCSARLSPGQGPVRRPYSVPTWTSAVADSFGWGCRPGFTGAPVFPDRLIA